VEARFLGFQALSGDGLLSLVGLLIFDRGDVTEVAVETLGVIPVHPGEGGEFDLFDAAPGALVGSSDQLGLVQIVDRFGESIVERLSGQSRRGEEREVAGGGARARSASETTSIRNSRSGPVTTPTSRRTPCTPKPRETTESN
jgi:hypothetical protein